MESFYENLQRCKVKRLDLKQKVDYSKIKMERLKSLTELILTNKDQRVTTNQSILAEKFITDSSHQRSSISTLGLRTYSIDKGLIELMSNIQNKCSIQSFKIIMNNQPYAKTDWLHVLEDQGIEQKKFSVDKVTINSIYNNHTHVQKEKTHINGIMQFIKLPFDHQGHSYIYPMIDLRQIECAQYLGQFLYKLTLDFTGFKPKGTLKKADMEFLLTQQSLRKSQSTSKVEELTIKGPIHIFLAKVLLASFPNVKTLIFGVDQYYLQPYNPKIAPFFSFNKLEKIMQLPQSVTIPQSIFEFIAEYSPRKKLQCKSLMLMGVKTLLPTVLSLVEPEALQKLSIDFMNSTSIVVEQRFDDIEHYGYSFKKLSKLKLTNIELSTRYQFQDQFALMMKSINTLKKLEITTQHEIDFTQKTIEQDSLGLRNALRDHLPKLTTLIIVPTRITVNYRQQNDIYISRQRNFLKNYINFILKERIQPLKVLVKCETDIMTYYQLQEVLLGTQHTVAFDKVINWKECKYILHNSETKLMEKEYPVFAEFIKRPIDDFLISYKEAKELKEAEEAKQLQATQEKSQ
ncbi:hypothetical protein FGO68_gene17 [Halteria grandinella]|uniref:Uncharacterized protein n=1 Tax=Halteria grandinella TaxID=5974 RepID=A0A8J8NYE8_HALGN|nr:hypothetical protein FGO68_gene17 [Halteria grandinella]